MNSRGPTIQCLPSFQPLLIYFPRSLVACVHGGTRAGCYWTLSMHLFPPCSCENLRQRPAGPACVTQTEVTAADTERRPPPCRQSQARCEREQKSGGGGGVSVRGRWARPWVAGVVVFHVVACKLAFSWSESSPMLTDICWITFLWLFLSFLYSLDTETFSRKIFRHYYLHNLMYYFWFMPF